jgi:sugar phosphate isomerase/epimerase
MSEKLNPQSQPLLAFSTLGCPDWSFDEIVARGVEYGYDGVEIRLIERETDLLQRPEFRPPQLAERQRQLGDAGFRVCGLASSVRFEETDSATRAAQLAAGRAYCDLAREFGAKFIRVFGDRLVADRDETEQLDWIASGLQRLGEYAATVGIEILIETHGDFCRSDKMVALMNRVSCPAVGVLWDTHHPWRFHGEPIADTWAALKPWTRHTHWKDSVTRPAHLPANVAPELAAQIAEAAKLAHATNTGHQPADYALFGGGEFPARECLQRLLADGYSGWYSLEWEKMWHPQIEVPEIAVRLFAQKFRELWQTL